MSLQSNTITAIGLNCKQAVDWLVITITSAGQWFIWAELFPILTSLFHPISKTTLFIPPHSVCAKTPRQNSSDVKTPPNQKSRSPLETKCNYYILSNRKQSPAVKLSTIIQLCKLKVHVFLPNPTTMLHPQSSYENYKSVSAVSTVSPSRRLFQWQPHVLTVPTPTLIQDAETTSHRYHGF